MYFKDPMGEPKNKGMEMNINTPLMRYHEEIFKLYVFHPDCYNKKKSRK